MSGGAIWNSFNGALVTGSVFIGNEALLSGGAIFNSNVITFNNSAFIHNSTLGFGGAIENYGTVNANNSTFSGNSADDGGAIHSGGTVNVTYVTFHGNSATFGGSVSRLAGNINASATLFSDGACEGGVSDLVGNIQHNAGGCVGAVVDPMLGALTANVHIPSATALSLGHVPPCLLGDDQLGNPRVGMAWCTAGAVQLPDDDDEEVVIPVVSAPAVLVLGCAFDAPSGMEVGNLPDNTYCRVLMRDGNPMGYPGAVHPDLVGLGVKLAVDIYRIEGGRSVVEFPSYARICLAGSGRYFYLDARDAPRYPIEMPTEQVNGMTCAWIPATGTVVLTQP